MVLEAGVLLGNWSEGIALPCWDPRPTPPKSGRKRAACNPVGRSLGCQMPQAGGQGSEVGLQGDEDAPSFLLCQGAVVLTSGAVCL